MHLCQWLSFPSPANKEEEYACQEKEDTPNLEFPGIQMDDMGAGKSSLLGPEEKMSKGEENRSRVVSNETIGLGKDGKGELEVNISADAVDFTHLKEDILLASAENKPSSVAENHITNDVTKVNKPLMKRKGRNKTRTRCADQPTELLEAFMSNQTTVKGGLMPVLGEIEHGMPSKHCFEIGDNCPEHEKKTQMRTSKMRLMRLLKQLVPLPPRRVQTTPEEVSKAFGLKTSKSGRLLVPPLAHWCNQTIAYDLDGGIIAVLDGSSKGNGDNGSFNFKPPEQKDASRIRKKLCNAATERILTPKSAKKACKD